MRVILPLILKLLSKRRLESSRKVENPDQSGDDLLRSLTENSGAEVEPNWASEHEPTLTFNFQQNLNLFSGVSGFKELENVSPEIRDKAFDYLSAEQQARHDWVTSNQKHHQQLELRKDGRDERLQARGQVIGLLVLVSTLAFAGWMMTIGQSAVGIGTIFFEITGVIGLVAWGKARENREKKDNQAENENTDADSS